MYFNTKCIGKLPGLTNEFERSLVFETSEFEPPKFDCKLKGLETGCMVKELIHNIFLLSSEISLSTTEPLEANVSQTAYTCLKPLIR